MLVLLAMARCAGVCGVDTTKAGNVLSGERCDLRNVLCGRCKVRVSKCMCRHSRLKGKRRCMSRVGLILHICSVGFGSQVFVEMNCLWR